MRIIRPDDLDQDVRSSTTVFLAGRHRTIVTVAMPIVVCPDDFWRKGNVEIMCERHEVAVYPDLESGIHALQETIGQQRHPD